VRETTYEANGGDNKEHDNEHQPSVEFIPMNDGRDMLALVSQILFNLFRRGRRTPQWRLSAPRRHCETAFAVEHNGGPTVP